MENPVVSPVGTYIAKTTCLLIDDNFKRFKIKVIEGKKYGSFFSLTEMYKHVLFFWPQPMKPKYHWLTHLLAHHCISGITLSIAMKYNMLITLECSLT